MPGFHPQRFLLNYLDGVLAAVSLKSSADGFIVKPSLRALPRPHPIPMKPVFLEWDPEISIFITRLDSSNVHSRLKVTASVPLAILKLSP